MVRRPPGPTPFPPPSALHGLRFTRAHPAIVKTGAAPFQPDGDWDRTEDEPPGYVRWDRPGWGCAAGRREDPGGGRRTFPTSRRLNAERSFFPGLHVLRVSVVIPPRADRICLPV